MVATATLCLAGLSLPTLQPAVLALPEEGSRTFELVRDLEGAPAHASFGGEIWQLSSTSGIATVAFANAALWRIEGDGIPPVLLLREVDRREVQQLNGRSLAARGADPGTGSEGLWIVDGDGAQLLAPPSLRPPTPWQRPTVARFDDMVLAKTMMFSEVGDSLWRLSAGAEPRALGPSGAILLDWNSPYRCATVAPTPRGLLHCRWDGYETGAALWLHDGASDTPVLPGLAVLDVWGSARLGGHHYIAASRWDEPQRVVVRTDGTVSGTEVFDLLDHEHGFYLDPDFIELGGRLGWLQVDQEGHWRLRATDGTSPPFTLAEGSSPRWPRAGGVAGGWLYLWPFLGSDASWALSLADGELREIATDGNHPWGFAEVESLGATVAFRVEANGASLWRIDPLSGFERLTAPMSGWLGSWPTITPRDGDPLIPMLGSEGRPRMGRFDAEGILQLWDGLKLGGNAGSSPLILGELYGEAILLAFTASEGATLWRSTGRAATTTPISPGITSACDRTPKQRPVLVEPDLVVDCIDVDGRAKAWRFDSLDLFHELDLQVTWSGWNADPRPPQIARVGGSVIHDGPSGLTATSFLGELPTTLVPDCDLPTIRRLTDRAVVACNGPRRGEIWSTDGSAEGTVLLLDLSDSGWMPRLASAGGLGIVVSSGSWLTDGSVEGTQAIGQLAVVADAAPGAAWTCASLGDGTIVRLDLPSGNLTAVGKANHVLRPLARAVPTAPILPLIEYLSGELWRCDGTAGGTRPLGVAERLERWDARSHAVTDSTLWTYEVKENLREELLAISLESGEIVAVRDRALPINDDLRLLSSSSSRTPPLRIAAGHLWASLSDEAHGREPWALRLERVAIFVDGFESGDTSLWSP